MGFWSAHRQNKQQSEPAVDKNMELMNAIGNVNKTIVENKAAISELETNRQVDREFLSEKMTTATPGTQLKS